MTRVQAEQLLREIQETRPQLSPRRAFDGPNGHVVWVEWLGESHVLHSHDDWRLFSARLPRRREVPS